MHFMIRIRKGLDLPIAGQPFQQVEPARGARSVALLGDDYVGMRPTMAVQEGDRVKLGDVVFTDKKTEGVRYNAPAAGRVAAINRGAKRALLSVVIDVEGDAEETFPAYERSRIAGLSRDDVVENLVRSGLWVAFRTRPFSRVPATNAVPHSLFVTAIDTNPLAADPALVIARDREAFETGLDIVGKLTEGKVFLCKAPGADVPAGTNPRVSVEEFAGPHPAGLAGTHIHFLDPVGPRKSVWHVGHQDVTAIGRLFTRGRIVPERIVALGGPGVQRPRLLETRLGASTMELTAGEISNGEGTHRVISGSVFSGRTAAGAVAYLGRFHTQISALPEDRSRHLIGYLAPGLEQHSVFPAFLSSWVNRRPLKFTTSTHGSPRGMVPIGTYEAVMPLDILATQLLRAILVGDVESAINLGCLELDEEDLALCTYACPSKYEYGPVLRHMLTIIEKEG